MITSATGTVINGLESEVTGKITVIIIGRVNGIVFPLRQEKSKTTAKCHVVVIINAVNITFFKYYKCDKIISP